MMVAVVSEKMAVRVAKECLRQELQEELYDVLNRIKSAGFRTYIQAKRQEDNEMFGNTVYVEPNHFHNSQGSSCLYY